MPLRTILATKRQTSNTIIQFSKPYNVKTTNVELEMPAAGENFKNLRFFIQSGALFQQSGKNCNSCRETLRETVWGGGLGSAWKLRAGVEDAGGAGASAPALFKVGGQCPSTFHHFLLEKCSKFDEKSQILKIFACGGQFQFDIHFLDFKWLQILYNCITYLTVLLLESLSGALNYIKYSKIFWGFTPRSRLHKISLSLPVFQANLRPCLR